jgi:hypothetical protein
MGAIAKERYWEEKEARRKEREQREKEPSALHDFFKNLFSKESKPTTHPRFHTRSMKERRMRRLRHAAMMRNV